MPAELQTRLLRVLADGEFYRVGGHAPVRVDVRIIAATHQDLDARVESGTFREDLFHRLNVIRVHSPALRERREDIPELLGHFLERAAREIAVEPKALRPEVARYLETLDWPGKRASAGKHVPLAHGDGVGERDPSRRSPARASRLGQRRRRRGRGLGGAAASMGGNAG